MNKKFSTLFTAGLLMAGSLFGSAWAGNIIPLKDAKSGEYLLKAAAFYRDGDSQWTKQGEDFYVNVDENGKIYVSTEKTYWTLTVGGVAGQARTYSFKAGGVSLALPYKDGSEDKVASVFAGDETTLDVDGDGTAETITALVWGANENNYWYVGHAGTDAMVKALLKSDATVANNANLDAFVLEEVEESTPGNLNELYNNKGFSFELNSDKTIENIFNQRIVALNVTSTILANEQTDPNNWGFPVGTYFTVSRPDGDYSKLTGNDEKYEYLKACKFIALSSYESVEVTADDRKAGKGFKLVEVSGADLYKYLGTAKDKLSSDKMVPVQNACFTVTKKSAGEYPFAINNDGFRYLADEDATGDDAAHSTEKVTVNIIEHNKSYYLTSVKGDTKNYIFKYGEAGIEKGIDLLESNGPAVYNIRFVSGANDKTELNKYLTIGKDDSNNNWDFFAKGEALAKDVLATPAYQFVITAVDKDNNVTFTNRESGHSFTAKLYKEDGGKYSLATTTSSTTNDVDFKIANINESTYAVNVVSTAKAFNDVEIELTKSEVDEFAGFWNVPTGTMVTMGFSRDVRTTSDILYALAKAKRTTGYDLIASNKAILTDELYDAAQWRLEKVDNGILKIKRDYVYNNNDKVATEPWGDVVSIQTYKIEFVNDAEETDYFLNQKSSGSSFQPELKKSWSVSDADTYVIRANADGSVDIMTKNSVKIDPNKKNGELQAISGGLGVTTSNNESYAYSYPLTYQIAEDAKAVKTYLLSEPPYKSWEKEGHVSLQSEIGNYLSMNEAKDGIFVDNDASAYYLYKTDENAVAPSYYITKGMKSENGERLFLFNTVDSIGYQMQGSYNPKYQWRENMNKVVFKPAIINETCDTLALTVKGEIDKLVADKSNNKDNVWAGLNRFKWQIIETEDQDGYYYIRQANNGVKEGAYLMNKNEKLTWGSKGEALKFRVQTVDAPTANESIADATEAVKVIAGNGTVTVQGAAGKQVTISNVLGKVIASTILTSDNATFNVSAGIAVVAVEGEAATKVVVK